MDLSLDGVMELDSKWRKCDIESFSDPITGGSSWKVWSLATTHRGKRQEMESLLLEPENEHETKVWREGWLFFLEHLICSSEGKMENFSLRI